MSKSLPWYKRNLLAATIKHLGGRRALRAFNCSRFRFKLQVVSQEGKVQETVLYVLRKTRTKPKQARKKALLALRICDGNVALGLSSTYAVLNICNVGGAG